MCKVFLCFLLLFFAKTGVACDCPPIVKLSADGIKQYHLIFRGRVDSTAIVRSRAVAWFTIDELYKGTATKVSAIYYDGSGPCQMQIDKGDEWIVYAIYTSYGKPELNFCSRSRKHFPDEKDDFYVVNNGLSYTDELAFLKSNLGLQTFVGTPSPSAEQQQAPRELIHPDHAQLLYWLLASLLGFLGIWFLLRKFLR